MFLKLNKKVIGNSYSITKEILKKLLRDYFFDSFEITSYIKDGKDSVANIKSNIQCQSDVDGFIRFYSREKNGTLKLKFEKGKRREV